MKDAYSFMSNVKDFSERVGEGKLGKLEDKIIKILLQTVECSVFIREYCGHGFGGEFY